MLSNIMRHLTGMTATICNCSILKSLMGPAS